MTENFKLRLMRAALFGLMLLAVAVLVLGLLSGHAGGFGAVAVCLAAAAVSLWTAEQRLKRGEPVMNRHAGLAAAVGGGVALITAVTVLLLYRHSG